MNRRVADTLIVVEDQVQRMRARIKLINQFGKKQGEIGRKVATAARGIAEKYYGNRT